MRAVLFSALVTIALGSCAPNCNSLARLEILTTERTYLAEILETDARGLDRSISIKCVSGCRAASAWREEMPAYPLGMFRLSDAMPLLMVTWGGGTRTIIQVFHLREEGIEKVFERHTLGEPLIRTVNGQLRISVSEYVEPGAGVRRILSRTWVWDQNRFAEESINFGDTNSGDTDTNSGDTTNFGDTNFGDTVPN